MLVKGIGSATFDNMGLRPDELAKVPPILEAGLAEINPGESSHVRIRKIITFGWKGKARLSRSVISEPITAIIQGSDDAYFDKVDQNEFAGFENLVSFVASVASKDALVEIIEELELVAARTLECQPNRLYVRCLFETDNGEEVCLVQYDRAGAAFGEWVDIRSDPETFVKLVLNVASRDVYTLGLDRSVIYQTKGGKKASGTIEVKGVIYEMVGVIPMYIEPGCGLRARATTCLKLKLKERGKEYVLKTTWRTARFVSEEQHKLERVKGLPGVVQMVDWDEALTTEELRGGIKDNECVYRVRILMECTGPSVAKFNSETELVAAFLDALTGLRNMWEKAGLMHGDVSIGNITLGAPGAPPGERGKVIDLDMALEADGYHLGFQGTISFMSMTNCQRAIAYTQRLGDHPFSLVPHCPPDDIESLFYTFSHAVGGTSGPSPLKLLFPSAWESPDAYEAAYNAKHDLYEWNCADDLAVDLPSHWSSPIRKLFRRFFKFIRDLVETKRNKIAYEPDKDKRDDQYACLLENVPEYFTTVQMFFKNALFELEDMGHGVPFFVADSPLEVPRPNSLGSVFLYDDLDFGSDFDDLDSPTLSSEPTTSVPCSTSSLGPYHNSGSTESSPPTKLPENVDFDHPRSPLSPRRVNIGNIGFAFAPGLDETYERPLKAKGRLPNDEIENQSSPVRRKRRVMEEWT